MTMKEGASCALMRAVAGLLIVSLSGCAAQLVKRQAQEQLAAGQFEQAVAALDAASARYPDDFEIRTARSRLRMEVTNRLLAEAASARAEGRFEHAEEALARLRTIGPDNSRARELQQAIVVDRRHAQALAEARTLIARQQWRAAGQLVTEALRDNPRQTDLVALQREIDAQLRRQAGAPNGLAETRPISLDFRDANLRTVLDLVSRNSGLNFVLDKDIRTDIRVTVYLRSAAVEDALDLIVSANGLEKKVLDSKTVLIYPRTPEKQREHQEQVVRVFYLSSADAKGAAAFLRAMLKVKEPYVDERTNMVSVRETPEVVQLSERLIALYDSHEPEVMLELEVLEVRATRLTELGVKFPSSVTLTPLSNSGGTGLTVNDLKTLNRDRVGVGISGLTLNLRRETGDFETLANPKVRVRNREKSRILIGDKLPVITTTTSQSGFVSDSVNYLDVGLKLEVEPTVFADDDVGIKLSLEVSSVAGQMKTNAGTLAYQVGTRNASTSLRLRDGETQILAGLVSREERSSANRVPGLGDLPAVGRLFSSQLDDGFRTELMLSITPRVLRNLRRPDAAQSELWIGTEAYTRLRSPAGRVAAAAAGEPVAGTARTASPAPREAGGAGAATSSDAGRAAFLGDGSVVLNWKAPEEVHVGQEFEVPVEIASAAPLRGLVLKTVFNKDMVVALDASEGGFFRQGGTPVNLSTASEADAGRQQVGVIRSQADGISGQGSFVRLKFKALKEGVIELGVAQADAIFLGAQPPQVERPQALQIQVKK